MATAFCVTANDRTLIRPIQAPTTFAAAGGYPSLIIELCQPGELELHSLVGFRPALYTLFTEVSTGHAKNRMIDTLQKLTGSWQ